MGFDSLNTHVAINMTATLAQLAEKLKAICGP